MDEFIKLLDPAYELIQYRIKEDKVIFHIASTITELECPFCGRKTDILFIKEKFKIFLCKEVLPQLSVIIVISHVPQLCFKQLPATSSIHCTFYHF